VVWLLGSIRRPAIVVLSTRGSRGSGFHWGRVHNRWMIEGKLVIEMAKPQIRFRHGFQQATYAFLHAMTGASGEIPWRSRAGRGHRSASDEGDRAALSVTAHRRIRQGHSRSD